LIPTFRSLPGHPLPHFGDRARVVITVKYG